MAELPVKPGARFQRASVGLGGARSADRPSILLNSYIKNEISCFIPSHRLYLKHCNLRNLSFPSLIILLFLQEHPTCALDITPTYAVVSSCISFYVPCIVMLGIYCRLYCYAQKHVKSIRAVTKLPDTSMAKSFRSKSSRCKPPKPQTKTKPTSPYHVSDHKAAITVGVIMGVFLVCWVPFFCVNIVAAYCKTCISHRAFQVLTWLGYSNSAFNPIIYSIFNTEFREAFKRILTKGARARGNQPSTSECGEFRSVVVQKRNGSMVECNISPRSSADSCQVGVMAQRHRDTIVSAI
ncbi:PREDICTED: dopamine receptor 1-like [Cyphomyrmex costatus]|uniref:dopamine receptor 1-like n=1 Tax=Cyphomyrmex costatus TaxID=456900 RepID=UPI00085229D0|nr:PREDICTED: dopamine receptor 1-like [Cyphomyrmex costatus]